MGLTGPVSGSSSSQWNQQMVARPIPPACPPWMQQNGSTAAQMDASNGGFNFSFGSLAPPPPPPPPMS